MKYVKTLMKFILLECGLTMINYNFRTNLVFLLNLS